MTKINLETKARAGFEAIMLRGGRLVKRKGQVISFAPHIGQLSSVSCGALAAGLALGVSLLGGAPAFAGTCDPLAPPPDPNGAAITCTGPADLIVDVTQEIVGQQLTVTTTSGFGISTSVGDGLSLTVGSGYNSGLTFVDTNTIASQITAAETAIDAYAVGRSSITTNANIEGGSYGIKFAVGSGGSLTIDATGSVEGTTYDGINAALTGEARDMTVRAADVIGGRTGIDVVNKAYGSTFVGSSNSVTAINGIGIIVNNENPRTENLTVDVVNVSGKAGGIDVANNGTGATSVSSSGEVYSSNGDGISAYNDASATDITIIANNVDAKNTGILAINLGKGNTTIDSRSYVKAGGDGISATNEIDALDLTITAVKVKSGDDGIVAFNYGKGATSVTATGDIVGAFNGISVANEVNAVTNTSNATDLRVKAVNVTGGINGIIAKNEGKGETYIKSTGSVIANSAAGIGIDVTSGASTTGLTIQANAVKGGKDGIDAVHSGRGSLSITTDGLVEGLDGFGIAAQNDILATDLTILATGDVRALLDGISAYNNGDGDTSITALGTVEATNVGISVMNGLDALDLEVSANVVTASGNYSIGIFAYNTGKGSTSVTATGAITANGDYDNSIVGNNARGIYVINSSTAENIEIIALDTVTGSDTGISARNEGAGSTSITASGLVTGYGINSGGGAGTGASGDGIYVYNGLNADALTVSAIDVTADKNGISVFNKGTGATTVSATGVVTGGVHGIYAKSDGTDLTIDVETDVTGGTSGIFAVNDGSGVTLINTTGPNLLGGGTVTGIAGNGIDVLNEVGASHLIVEVANVTGATNGIKTVNKGNGSYTSITAFGAVKGTGANSDGINALSGTGTDYLKIVTNSVEGIDDGIDAQNDGNGFTTITANGLVKGGVNGNGFEVNNATTAGALTISAAAVTGGVNGIFAKNDGTGATFVSASGTVSGATADGIYAATAGLNLTINTTAAVSGGDDGIDAKNDGAGFTLITAIGNVEGKGTRDGIGISAVNAGTASSLEIKANNANTVQAGGIGISAQNLGNGATSVSSTGNVIGAFFDGINALNSGTTLTIDVNTVTGGDDGIDAQNDGNGFTLITANGLVTGGAGGNGIEVNNAATATDLTVNAAAVTGGVNGIFAENLGTGVTVVTATGLVGGTAVDGFTTADGISVTNSALGNTAIPAGQTAPPLIGMQVSAHDVNGGVNGIFADHNGAGGLVITADGTVNGRSADGINANNSTLGTYLSITTAAVTGGVNGIFAENAGDGFTLITATGTVTGQGTYGIYAKNETSATDLTISAAAVTGDENGIFALNYGTGATLVSASGAVTGTTSDGIYAKNDGTDLTVNTTAAVTGDYNGIYARNRGSGATFVSASGAVTGSGANGIHAKNDGTNLTVNTTAAVTGDDSGIFAENDGTGFTSITATGLVTGGDNGIKVENDASTTALTINAAAVTGGVSGIVAKNLGTGATLISASGDVSGGTGFGIYAQNGDYAQNVAGGTNLTIDVEADVTGGTSGIFAINNGSGVTLINTTGPNLLGGGTVTGYAGNGIDVLNEVDASDLIIEAASVTGSEYGIKAVNKSDNGGSTSITATGDVLGEAEEGIYALNEVGTTNLTITATGKVKGDVNGISAENLGTGATFISASGAVTGTTTDGIYAKNDGTDLTVSAAAVTGNDYGIYARNIGTGVTLVSASGAVTGGADGIFATTAGTNLTINTTAAVTGGDDGIDAQNNGDGFTLITATGLVTGGTNGNGIEVNNAATATDLTVNANAVSGGENGIFAENLGTGTTVVTATGLVGGTAVDGFTTADGIHVTNSALGNTAIPVGQAAAPLVGMRVSAHDVNGGVNGIFADHNGAGGLVITADGTVNGRSANGIYADNSTLGTYLSITTATVTGGVNGVFAVNNGKGATSITSTGDVTGDGSFGIAAFNLGGDTTDLTIEARGTVTGGNIGILADNRGVGATLITATGAVTGGGQAGIDAFNNASATDLTVNAVDVAGGVTGIVALNNGTGVTIVSATGLVGGTAADGYTTADGISVTNSALGNTAIPAGQILAPLIGMQVSAHDVNGGVNGIFADHNGAGGLVITADGTVNGRSADGINANNSTLGTYLSITTAAVAGGVNGIFAENLGTGATLVSASGAVAGGTADGIHALNAGTNLTVKAAAVTGGVNGIFADNAGDGFTLITAIGSVTGQGIDGIYANNGVGTSNLEIIANVVTGFDDGIDVQNDGDGFASVTATGRVTGGVNGNGIEVNNAASATNLTISAATVASGVNGIFAENLGTGATLVSASGAVTGGTADGIHATNAGTNLTVNAAAVTGGLNGIFADNAGDGFVSITANGPVTGGLNGILAVNKGAGATSVSVTGPVTGTALDGINIRNSGANLTISAINVTGGDDGIDAFNSGPGATSIISTAIVTAGDNGIEVINGAAGTNLTVITKDVTAGDDGINAFNLGSGSTVIRATGAVTGGKQGVFAFNAVSAEDLTVNVVDVSGETDGISVANLGRGFTSVTATGTVEGADGSGIYVYNATEASGLTVSASNVTGGVDGIYVVHNGTGDTVVTASGAVDGATGVGILAIALNTEGGALRITANSASGLLGGIVAQNDGAGASTVSVTGTIAGGDGAGIETSTLAGNLTTVNLASTAIIGATSGKAIANNDGNSILNVSANAVINGSVELDGGTDTANFARNGALASVNLLDGGDNAASADGSVDTLNLNGADDVNLVGANMVNWEVININGGTIGFSDARILAETINVNNRATLNGANNLVATANVNIAAGAALIVGNAGGNGVSRITGNLVNAGLLNLSGNTAVGRAGDTLSIAGNYTGVAAQVRLDTVLNGDNSLTDRLNVAGNVTGSSLLTVNNAGGIGGLTTGDGIRIVQVGGTSAQDGFVLRDELQVGAFRYDLFLGGVTDPNDQDWYLRTVGLTDVAATTLSFARLSDDIAMTFLGTLHERVGEQEHLAKRGYQSGRVSGLWGRFVGKGFREKLASSTLGDVKSTGSITGLQMGLDFVRTIKGDGSATFAGVYSGYADGSSSDQNIFQGVARRSGTSNSKGWLTGLYGTHYSSTGWYANVVVQANWVDASANGRDGTVFKADGRTYLSSFELGQSLKLADRLAFETQAQLIYGDTQFDAARDSNGIENRVGIESSLIGRAGFRLKTTKSEKYNAEGGLFSGYLKANLWHNLSGADVELFNSGQAVGNFEPKKTWVDVGLGTTLTFSKNTELFFDADVEFGLDQKTTSGTGKVGLRINW